MRKKSKEKKGISLIVLVITIIVMIILAATIIISLNNNGIIKNANEAVEKTNLATVKELAQVKWAEAFLDKNIKPSERGQYVITELVKAGIKTEDYEITVTDKGVDVSVKQKSNVPTDWQAYVVNITEDGVPIPKGFVASQATGENTKNGGLVIYEGTEPVTDANVFDAKINRNQYVWVPVDDFTKFIRQNFGLSYTMCNTLGTSDEYWELEVDENNMPKGKTLLSDYIADNDLDYITEATIAEVQAMYASVKEYKGFYIARYEAGLEVGSHKRSDDGVITTAVHSKMNKAPYNYVRYSAAMNQDTNGVVEVARSIYPETNANYGVVSTLTYGVQWDRTLAWWIETEAKNGTGDVTIESNTQINDSTNYGNYKNNEIPLNTFNNGAKYLLYSSSNGSLATTYADVTAKKTTDDYWLLTTGATEEARVNNIYDMAGNLWEWTMEGHSSDRRVRRGGGFVTFGDYYPVSYRYNNAPLDANLYIGFRTSLYIKK